VTEYPRTPIIPPPAMPTLTQRDQELLWYIGRFGMGVKDIARELHISRKTVDAQIESLVCRLQLNNGHRLVSLAIFAVRAGMAEPTPPPTIPRLPTTNYRPPERTARSWARSPESRNGKA
jgi:DNA-binding CsgD family transcriptional regulator